MEELSGRQKLILKAIIQEYVTNIEPISSKLLDDKYELGISTATIRNEMATLEKLQYLDHPHTSAGRVPTTKGYRLYVDSLIDNSETACQPPFSSTEMFDFADREVNDILHQATTLLSQITSYISIMRLPPKHSVYIKHFNLLKLAPKTILLIAFDSKGEVYKERIDMQKSLSDHILQNIENIINKLYAEKHVSIIKESKKPDVRGLGLPDECDVFFNRLTNLFEENHNSRVLMEGLSTITQDSYFKFLDKSQDLLIIFGNKERVARFLDNIDQNEGLTIRIGNEMAEISDNCSYIGANYYYGSSSYGTLGLIGPCHMDYQRAISAVRFFTNNLSATFEKIV